MAKLYEIASNYNQVLELLDDPERFDQLKDTLDAIDENMNDKLESVGKIRASYLAEAAMLKAEAKRLTEKAAAAEKQASNLTGYVEHVMKTNKFDKLKTPLYTFSFRKSTALVVTDEKEVPEQFLKPQPSTVDVAGLKKHLKQTYDDLGIDMPDDFTDTLGVKFEHKHNLQIK